MSKVIRKGDTTTTGGAVLEGNEGVLIEGALVASIGHRASCPRCPQGGGLILALHERTLKLPAGWAALEGDIVACGCPPGSNRLMTTQQSVQHALAAPLVRDRQAAVKEPRSLQDRLASLCSSWRGNAGTSGAQERGRIFNSTVEQSLALLGKTKADLAKRTHPPTYEKLYRRDVYPLNLPDTYEDLNQRLADILVHIAIGRSTERVQSFRASEEIAKAASPSRMKSQLHEVCVSKEEGIFLSAAEIIYRHGDRLIDIGKVSTGTVRVAIAQLFRNTEPEYFWLGRY